MSTLWRQGGVRRLYSGVTAALVHGPLSRAGDTAANAGVLTFLASREDTRDLPVVLRTSVASAAAAAWRVTLAPIDTVKAILMVEGRSGYPALVAKVHGSGLGVLWHGSAAACTATFVGHWPWFATYNFLDETIPVPDALATSLLRNAGIGFSASLVSDTASNAIRVLKTSRQTAVTPLSYGAAARAIVDKEGVLGLLGRGLGTRILANGVAGIVFTVTWKLLQTEVAVVRA